MAASCFKEHGSAEGQHCGAPGEALSYNVSSTVSGKPTAGIHPRLAIAAPRRNAISREESGALAGDVAQDAERHSRLLSCVDRVSHLSCCSPYDVSEGINRGCLSLDGIEPFIYERRERVIVAHEFFPVYRVRLIDGKLQCRGVRDGSASLLRRLFDQGSSGSMPGRECQRAFLPWPASPISAFRVIGAGATVLAATLANRKGSLQQSFGARICAGRKLVS
ncbi:hypothetical protein ACVILH_006335 [Bradyrhizobium sp. USDA 4353]